MRTVSLSVLALAILAGCSTAPESPTATPTHLPDGRAGHAIKCSGSMSGCYEQAGEACKGKGYDVVTQQQSRSTSIGFTGARQQNVYDLLIACKG